MTTTAIQAQDAQTRTKEPDYEALAKAHERPCISLYMNGGSPIGPAKNDLKRVKDELRKAATSFEGTSMTVDDAERLLESNWRLIQDGTWAQAANEGVAIFLSRDFAGCCRIASPVGERFVVGSEFFVRPLLPLIPANDRFFVLALSQKHVRLFEGSRRGMEERHLQETPANLHEDLAGLSFERCYEMHTAASPASNQKGAIFHGPGISNKDRLIHFFRDVDRGVASLLKGQQAPLIVAAVEYLFPIYKEANTYPHLLEDVIRGNPDALSPDALHTASWKIFEKHLSAEAGRALDVYKAHINTPLTSSNLRKVVAAAASGTVRFLFVPATGEQWGLFEPPETVHIHETKETGDDELLNLAAILTLRHGGEVHVVRADQLRPGAEVGAVLRF
jgi:hypothetical protein